MTHDPSDKPKKADYTVGYGKPPVRTRFKPGQSGNPKGRPRGARNFDTELAAELAERIAVREGGRLRQLPKRRAVVKAVTAKALQGNTAAAKLVLEHEERALARRLARPQAPVDLSPSDAAILADYVRRTTEGDTHD